MMRNWLLALALAANAAIGAEFALTTRGKPSSVIVLSEGAGPVEKRAAAELSRYLGRISGGDPAPIAPAPAANSYTINIGTLADPLLASRLDARTAAEIGPEGFALVATPQGLSIVGRNPIGVLYGAYEILKKCGGIRWLVPGEDGEYYRVKPTIAVPAQVTVRNPSFPHRTFSLDCMNVNSPAWDTYDWMVRNNLRVKAMVGVLNQMEDKFVARGAVSADGGHAFSTLLGGHLLPDVGYAQGNARLQSLFAEHPDYFPLINGKRVMLGNQQYQPCTTQPEVIRIMSDNLTRWLPVMWPGGSFLIGNDDGTGWCQCENCVRLDPDTERRSRFVSTRYWTFTNQVARAVWAQYPDAALWGWAYQNFQTPPDGVKPDPRLHVMLSFNRRCWRHRLADPNCPVNRVFLQYYRDWARLGNPLVSREETFVGLNYLPSEHTLPDGFRTYRELGMAGASLAVVPPDGTFGPTWNHPGVTLYWYRMWQSLYLAANLLWDVDSDDDQLYEEAGAFYYGAAWDRGMREYRALLIKTASETPGCYGWGHGAPAGRNLDQPGVHERLLALLAAAEQAAVNEPRALAHVKRDRRFFAETWEAARQEYLDNYRDIRAYARTSPLVIDGRLDEPDWKNADVTTAFRHEKQLPREQTFVRVTYEPDYLYVAIEAMEPQPERMEAAIAARDGAVWNDNGLEIFITHPDLNDNYYHLIFNHHGVLYDAFNTKGQPVADLQYDSRAQIQTAILADRWVAEVKIPTAPLGMACADGHTWKLNVARTRALDDGSKEHSSMANGVFHGAEHFVPTAFAGKRALAAVSFGEVDTRFWKNGAFDEVQTRPDGKSGFGLGANRLEPKFWSMAIENPALDMALHPGSETNFYVKLVSGAIFQITTDRSPAYAIHFRAAGEGVLRVLIFRYRRTGDESWDTFVGSDGVEEVKLQSPEWRNFRFQYTKQNDEIVGLALARVSGDIRLDDVYLSPAPQRP